MGCFLNELRGGFRLEHGSRTMENKQQASAQFSPYNYSSYPTFLIQENGGEGIFYKIFFFLFLSLSLKIVIRSRRVERERVYVSRDDNFHPAFEFHLPFSFRLLSCR